MWDVFISHASRDKSSVVLPLADRLERADFRICVDSHSFTSGNLRELIDNAIQQSKSIVVVLSHSYIESDWTRAEFNAIMARRVHFKDQKIIPIWHDISDLEVQKFSPLIGGELGIRTEHGIDYVSQKLINILRPVRKDDLKYSDFGFYLKQAREQIIAKNYHGALATLDTLGVSSDEIVNAGTYFLRSIASYHINDYQQTIELCSHCLQISQSNNIIQGMTDGLYAYRAMAYMQLRHREKALEDARKSLAINQNNEFALCIVIHYYWLVDNHDMVINLSNKYLVKHPDGDNVFDPAMNIRYKKAHALFSKQKIVECQVELDKLLAYHPNYTDAFYLKAICFLSWNNYKTALKIIEHAITLEPTDAKLYSTRSRVYYFLRRYDESVRDVKVALRLDPELSSARTWLIRLRHEKRGGA